MGRLGQQVLRLTEQIAMLLANQNTFCPLDLSSDGDKEGSNEESSEEDLVPQQRRVARGNLMPKEFLDWLRFMEEILEFKNVPTNARVALVATQLQRRATTWWQQLKLSRTRLGKLGKSKLMDWEKMKRKLRS
ncbi:hypothetical protein Ddye_009096 [Dipteronia dyeriana]|uniref:Retrotransposon gag domain-containing protein n=1 Tax=Dipteronia dyeriana TaxID=168575 RepID=A0AAD9XAR4_9ROSI|nr:hypothetical protein Ddye_009096 [Dipteronia dyeriana]